MSRFGQMTTTDNPFDVPREVLDLNRRGELTEQQATLLKRSMRARGRMLLIFMAAAPPVIAIFLTITSDDNGIGDYFLFALAMYALTAVIGLVGLFALWFQNRSPKVTETRGEVLRIIPKKSDALVMVGRTSVTARNFTLPGGAERMAKGEQWTVFHTRGVVHAVVRD